jgi:hypothetical protein
MSVRPAIPAHGDQHGRHTMPCSRRAPPPRGPALHGAASFEAPALSGVCLSACSGSQQPAAREGSHSVCPVPCISAPLPPVSGSHCCGPLVLLPAVFMQASPCGHLMRLTQRMCSDLSAPRARVRVAAATHLRIPVAPPRLDAAPAVEVVLHLWAPLPCPRRFANSRALSLTHARVPRVLALRSRRSGYTFGRSPAAHASVHVPSLAEVPVRKGCQPVRAREQTA